MMHKLLSSRTVSNDGINKNHHKQQHYQQQQVHQHQPVQQQIPLKSQSHLSVQQHNKQKQQNNQHSINHRYNNHLSPTRVGKDATNYEKFISSCSGSGTIKSISDIQPSKVKMSGYLKKKRTKVGGWRKMWFVLQNQLLLSYSSKENYDKKLVSFKDVLNLVPGTTIHPLGSFRFAIETTTNVMYNFRCDDSESYNQWLNALVESLSLNLQERSTKANETSDNNNSSNNSKNKQQQKFKNSISLDNIQKTTPPNKKPIKSCNSSDSISRFNLSRMPNIPIADATAKILQRNGIPSNGGNNNEFNNIQKKIGQNDRNRNSVGSINSSGGSNHSSNSAVVNNVNKSNRQNHEQLEAFCDKQERARNFRLHEKRLSSGMLQQNLHQSDEVSRINRMFSRSRSANNVTNSTTTASETTTQQATVVLLNDKNSFVTKQATTILGASIGALKTTSTSSPCSSIVNIVSNPTIVGKVKPLSSSSTSSSSLLTSNGTSVGIASIISLKDGYGRSYTEQRNPLNYHTNNNNNNNKTDSFFINNNGNKINLNHRLTDNRNLLEQQQQQYEQQQKLNKKQSKYNNIIKNHNRRDCNSSNNSGYNYRDNNYKYHNLLSDNKNIIGDISGSDKRNSQQFFPVTEPSSSIMTNNDNKDIIFNNEMDIVINDHISNSNSVSSDNSNGDGSSNNSSPIKYKIMENSKKSDNNDSQQNFINNINNGGNNSYCSNSSSNSINNSNSSNSNNDIISNNDDKNQINNDDDNNDIRDLNQNRMCHVNYEKIDFQKDKDDDGDYECYPLEQKMQDLNICKHQQSKQNVTADKKTINQNSSPFKKSISLERGGQHPFYTDTEFPILSKNHHYHHQQQYNHHNNQFGIISTSSPHQSLQNFSHIINSPVKDEFSLSSSSTTTSNSRCNSSLVTTESTHSITNSPTNDENVNQQRQQLKYQNQHNRKPLTVTTSTPIKLMDSRIHPDLQPSESIENDLHMMNIIVHNDGDGESTTEDIFVNIVTDEQQRPASAQCMTSIEHNTEDGSEPIYALVNLKNKHARRAKLRELQDQLAMLTEARDRDRPRSLQCISSDYEEVLNFECMQDGNDAGEDDEDDDENENIYEPINIPEYGHQRQQNNHRHALWKYFRRINIEALLDLARSKKIRSPRHIANASKYDSASLQPTMSLPSDAYSHHQHHQTSPFSDIRRKLGNHRKSIKLRMKRFYNRHDLRNSHTNVHSNAIIKERNAFSDDELDSQGATGSTGSGASENSLKSSDGTTAGNDEKRTTTTTTTTTSSSSFVFGEIDKYRRSQKQFFGSLTRLKKTRTSVSLEEDDVKIFSNNMINSNSNSSCNDNKPWLVSPKINRSEEKISIVSTKFPKKNDDIPNQTKFYKN